MYIDICYVALCVCVCVLKQLSRAFARGKVYWTQLGTQYKARGGPSVQRNSKLQRANLDGSNSPALLAVAKPIGPDQAAAVVVVADR